VAGSELSRRQKILFVSAALAGVPLFVGLVMASGGVHWALIAVGVALEASFAVYGVVAGRRDRKQR
jgi:hypothetical protein